MSEQSEAQQALAKELEQTLTKRYGLMLGSGVLWRELGYSSSAAFRVAIARGSVELPVFGISGRKGKFALAKDVAAWIAHQRYAALVHPA
ncbi:hypothetical protein [Pseudomonas aeruginosa]|uniref:hypothetical protein n=1 Tax=Pseudomonas aeruginosa TaxID=287 RepID=UPI000DEF16BB|nr:hypothetical protein [Pseudomonas aeruginosa]MBP8439188.1 hypothetical protein [Pseudomonas aeruginosa]MBP8445253.1 hypothetical protein [Pseudomonas aeruginosa]MBP8469346.1 hypothetical protein [Pseudomonas aeruginosa]MBP8480755.1 hypothetical protein [Pseudomonas aeruginosa]MBP8527913.1 hypothetical protein [Pseudomonas aeruginosa]